jgi:hypothetical protein
MTGMTEIRRAAFEAKYPVPEDVYWGEHVNTYCASGVADSYSCNYWMMWDCWKAAIDSVVVELPPIERMAGDDGVESEIMQPRRVVAAIHDAGIKTK